MKYKHDKKRMNEIRIASRQGDKKYPLVICKDPKLNHYLGRVFARDETIPLASGGWKKTKSFGDYFILQGHGQNPSLTDIYHQSFLTLGLNEKITSAIEKMGINSPTAAQVEAIPFILRRHNVVVCAETGCGKTLAYLAPTFQNMLEDKKRFGSKLQPNMPLGLVLLPGRELAEQTANFATELGKSLGIGVRTVLGGYTSSQFSSQSIPCDLIVASLGKMQKLVTSGVYNVNFVKHIIVDECDSLVDDTFIDPLTKLLKRIHIKDGILDEEFTDTGAQLSFVGATVPRDLNYTFEDLVNTTNLEWIKTPYLHKIMPHVTQTFLRVDRSQKANKILEILSKETDSKDPIMIFTNRSQATTWLSRYLYENGFPNAYFQGNLDPELRKEQFEAFQNGFYKLLICTDLGSRGLNTIRVKHVINFEFPTHMSDYIHRVGRTGRVGTEGGRVTNLISTRVELPLVQQIEMAARMIKSLPNVDGNIRRQIDSYIASKQDTEDE